jgi:hypothetical protein
MLGGQLQAGSIHDAVTAIWKILGNQFIEFGGDAVSLSRVPILPGLHRDQIRQSFL